MLGSHLAIITIIIVVALRSVGVQVGTRSGVFYFCLVDCFHFVVRQEGLLVSAKRSGGSCCVWILLVLTLFLYGVEGVCSYAFRSRGEFVELFYGARCS